MLAGTLLLAAPSAMHPQNAPGVAASMPSPGAWGDQNDGSFANPVMPGDFSDLDAIRAGDMFYAISSTMQYSPGMAVLASPDLVNWTISGHVVPDLTRISPELNWNRMDRRGRGIWAGSIRYHGGRFRVVFGTPDEGLFMSSARRAAGPWSPPVSLLAQPGWDDPCPFWDEDGQIYLVATQFKRDADSRTYTIHLWKMTADGTALLPGSDRILYQSNGSEANKLYKIDGYYYHYFSEIHGEGRVGMMRRARSLGGPWETRQLIHVNPAVDKEPNQGGLIQLRSGKWYFVTHQGTGGWEGRAGVLLPVTWVDGWPILGKPGLDGIGTMVWQGEKPMQGFARTSLAASDDFNGQTLRPEWEWNYQPRAGKWSLGDRPGFLRLYAFQALRKGDFSSIGNILTQRSMRTRRSQVTARVELGGMVDGQEAGLAHFARSFSTLGVVQKGRVRRLSWNENGERVEGPVIGQAVLWLRSNWGEDGTSQFSYSLDGQTFETCGKPYQLAWGYYRGDRIGLFTVQAQGEDGYLDVDSFQYDLAR